jgi:hypothetical protein
MSEHSSCMVLIVSGPIQLNKFFIFAEASLYHFLLNRPCCTDRVLGPGEGVSQKCHFRQTRATMLHKQLWKIVHVGPGDLDSRVSDPDCPEPESFASENFNLKKFVREGWRVRRRAGDFLPHGDFSSHGVWMAWRSDPMDVGGPGDSTPWSLEAMEISGAGKKKVKNFPAPEVVQPTHGVKSPGPIWTFFQSCLCNIVARVCRK